MKVLERTLYDELLIRTIDKIDTRQHEFLRNKSCNTNLLLFTESIARSVHEKIGTDVIYFDFAKAFDTVSHDLILQKLKAQYNIDGTLLKFLTEYLHRRKQRVIMEMLHPKVQTYCQVSLRDQFWAHFSFSLLTTYMQILPYTLMILKSGET